MPSRMVSKKSLIPDNKVSQMPKHMDIEQTTEDKTQELNQFKFINNKKLSQETELSPIQRDASIHFPVRAQSVTKPRPEQKALNESKDHSRARIKTGVLNKSSGKKNFKGLMQEKPSEDFLRNKSCKFDPFPQLGLRNQKSKKQRGMKKLEKLKKNLKANKTQQSIFKPKKVTRVPHEMSQVLKTHLKTQNEDSLKNRTQTEEQLVKRRTVKKFPNEKIGRLSSIEKMVGGKVKTQGQKEWKREKGKLFKPLGNKAKMTDSQKMLFNKLFESDD